MPSRVGPSGNQVANTQAPIAFANGVANGQIGYATTTTAQAVGSGGANLTGLSVTVTTNANRRIRVEGYVPIGGYGAGTADERAYVRIYENATELSGDAVIERISSGSLIQGTARPVALLSPSAGNHTYLLTMEGLTTANASTAATTAPAATRPAWIEVTDCGPAF